MKYIPADKLIAEIKRYKNKADERLKIKGRTFSEEQKDLALQNLCGNLLHFIVSLQQEQPEVDLEKEMEDYLGENWKDDTLTEVQDDMIQFARHFYELGQIDAANKFDEIEYNRLREEAQENNERKEE